MHTDRKIGFAMGILLIGIVAALFFRNEPLLSTRVPGVRRERELNAQLRERDVAVYLNDNVADESPEEALTDQPWTLRDVLKKMDERNKTAPIPVGAGSFTADPVVEINDAELDGYRPKKRRAANAATIPESASGLRDVFLDRDEPPAGRGTHGALPPLLPVKRDDADVAKTAVAPISENADPGGSRDGLPPVVPAAEFQPPENFDEYVVKYGDTLSGIAQRTLGSQKKYMDIYHANQDRMASPDRLDVGKPLRIPRVADNERQTY